MSGDESDAEDRDAILARRARFVATALIGMSVLPACDTFPRPCLEAQPIDTSGAPPPEPPPPMPCLKTGAPAPSSEAPPHPCLDVEPTAPGSTSATPSSAPAPPSSSSAPKARKPPPQPCLLMWIHRPSIDEDEK